MSKHKYHKSTLSRVRVAREITKQHYEAGNNSRCYKAVWRHYVYPALGCCYRTYLNYLGIPVNSDKATKQPSLFDFIEEDPKE